MATCRVCGIELRTGDDVVAAFEQVAHASCVDAPVVPRRRRLGAWASMGSRGQMGLGDVQRAGATADGGPQVG